MHIVEICREGDGLAPVMTQMRTWLDAKHIEPAVFRMSLMPESTLFRLAFQNRSEAAAFAGVFGGKVVLEPGDHPLAA